MKKFVSLVLLSSVALVSSNAFAATNTLDWDCKAPAPKKGEKAQVVRAVEIGSGDDGMRMVIKYRTQGGEVAFAIEGQNLTPAMGADSSRYTTRNTLTSFLITHGDLVYGMTAVGEFVPGQGALLDGETPIDVSGEKLVCTYTGPTAPPFTE